MMTNRKTSMAALAATLVLAATATQPAYAQSAAPEPILIGMLDTSVQRLPNKPKGVEIVSKDFTTGTPAKWEGESSYSHGELVAASAVAAARAANPESKINLFVSNIYTPSRSDATRFAGGRVERGLEDPTMIRLTIDFQAAAKAVDWMSTHGVKVVIVTANGNDSQGMRMLTGRIRDAGMILVASTNNEAVKSRVFPAAYPDVISVASNNKGQPISFSADLASYVSYVADGRSPTEKSAPKEIGSSFAAGSIGGLVAVYAGSVPDPDVKGAKAWLDERSDRQEYSGHEVSTVAIARFSPSLRIVRSETGAKKPAGVEVAFQHVVDRNPQGR